MIRIIIIVIIIINNSYQLDYMQVRRPKTWCRLCGKAPLKLGGGGRGGHGRWTLQCTRLWREEVKRC